MARFCGSYGASVTRRPEEVKLFEAGKAVVGVVVWIIMDLIRLERFVSASWGARMQQESAIVLDR